MQRCAAVGLDPLYLRSFSTHWIRATLITLSGFTVFWMMVQDLSTNLQRVPLNVLHAGDARLEAKEMQCVCACHRPQKAAVRAYGNYLAFPRLVEELG